MGLDMGLNKITAITGEIREALKGVAGIDVSKLQSITEEYAYWRKADAIHNWMVENVQNGEDNCGTFYVPEDAMENLLTLVNEVLDADPKDQMAVAMDVLPSMSVYFSKNNKEEAFAFYLEDLAHTKRVFESALEEARSPRPVYFEYWSSW